MSAVVSFWRRRRRRAKCSCGADEDEDEGLGVSSSGMKKMDGEDEGGAVDLGALAFAFVGGLGGRCGSVVVGIAYVFFWYLTAYKTGRIWAKYCHIVPTVQGRFVVAGKSSVGKPAEVRLAASECPTVD
jgi:hypothetical protein